MSVDPHARRIREINLRERCPTRRSVMLLEYVARQPEDQLVDCASVLIQDLTTLQALYAQMRRCKVS